MGKLKDQKIQNEEEYLEEEQEILRQKSIKRAEKIAEAEASADMRSSTVDTKDSRHPSLAAERDMEPEEYGKHRGDGSVAAKRLADIKSMLGMRHE